MKTQILARWRTRSRLALFHLAGGGLSIGLVAAVALCFESSFLFPSLGPTAFLLFYTPESEVSSPRSTLLGHLIGALAGWLSLAVFGLLDAPPALVAGVDWPRVGAAALSLGGTSALMVLLDAVHPPAGATTLIVSLGLMPSLWQIPILMGAMLLLLGQAMILNRLAEIPARSGSKNRSAESARISPEEPAVRDLRHTAGGDRR